MPSFPKTELGEVLYCGSIRRLAQAHVIWSLRSQRDVLFRPRIVASILSCALPFYHRIYSSGQLQFVTNSGPRSPHLWSWAFILMTNPISIPLTNKPWLSLNAFALGKAIVAAGSIWIVHVRFPLGYRARERTTVKKSLTGATPSC